MISLALTTFPTSAFVRFAQLQHLHQLLPVPVVLGKLESTKIR